MRIHFIAIGGSIMHGLALAMQAAGHGVTGSDDEIYEPSRTRLADAGLLPSQMGWHPDRITPDINIVVLGMHARKDNPELERAKQLNLQIASFPAFIYQISKDKIRVVVAGSHGKTTTTGMIAHVLDQAGMAADRMIGASIGELAPVRISDAPLIILEGDEYLSSPDDPRAKFLHYQPHITVITGIAWDHMNVFPTYADYIEPFRQLIRSLGPDDTLIYCADDHDLVVLVREEEPPCICIPYSAHSYTMSSGQTTVSDNKGQLYKLKVFGHHNLQNLKAAQLVSTILGVEPERFYPAISSFSGANRRLQVLHEDERRVAYLDFAHAPSKVMATVKAVREKHPDAFLIACLELHTFSSLNPVFLPQYKDTLSAADMKIVYYSAHTLQQKKLTGLSAAEISGFFNAPDLIVVETPGALEQLVRSVQPQQTVTVMLWMSSGRFDGLKLW